MLGWYEGKQVMRLYAEAECKVESIAQENKLYCADSGVGKHVVCTKSKLLFLDTGLTFHADVYTTHSVGLRKQYLTTPI